MIDKLIQFITVNFLKTSGQLRMKEFDYVKKTECYQDHFK